MPSRRLVIHLVSPLYSYVDHLSTSTVTALQARTFAVWTLTSAIVRIYAAYNINDKRQVVQGA